MPGMRQKSMAFVPRYQKFESISLHRRVLCEPLFNARETGLDKQQAVQEKPALLACYREGINAARVRLIVWCEACQHQVEPEPAEQITSAMFTEMAVRYGAETPVLDWRERLVCSRCGSRQVDMVARVKCARSPLLPPLQ